METGQRPSDGSGDDRPIVGLGLVNKDFVARVPAWERDTKTNASVYFEQVGGPVPVALTALARLGAPGPVVFLGVVGDDRDGDELACALADEGVDAAHLVRVPGASTSKSLVVLDERDGARSVANYAGGLPPLTLSPAHEALLARARLLHLDGRDLPAGLRAAEIVQSNGGLVSLDLGTMRPGREALLARCDIVLASRKGGAGAFPEVADAPAEQVERFLRLGASVAGVTLGAAGSVVGVHEGGPPIHLPAFAPPGPVVDTCGAGDLFHGAFLWAYLSGRDPRAAADFAQAAVALRTTRLGNEAGLPARAEVEAFLASTPVRA